MSARCGLRKRHSSSTTSIRRRPNIWSCPPVHYGPSPEEAWESAFKSQYSLPVSERRGFFVIWLGDERPIGFSSCDKIVFGKQANMHLHVTEPTERQRGTGAQCVRLSVDIYFRMLKISQLFCEPNAFNVGPNRTLQRAGFSYVKTHMTVPGPLNFHQPVNRWLLERAPGS